MKTIQLNRLLVAAGAAATLLLSPLSASAYSSLVIFGDSLSDGGNNALVIGTDPGQVITGNTYVPTFAYASGTYSNGDVWANSFAAGLGLSASPSLAGGTNYAYGGAETHGFGFPPSLRTQVKKYLGTAPADASDALYVIAGGGNNARSALEAIAGGASAQRTITSAARRYANDVGTMIDQLQAAGAEHIVVWNTPDIGVTPAVLSLGAEASGLASLIAAQMNIALDARLASESGVLTFDAYGLLGSVVANPGAYGLSNVTDACGAVLGCDPSTYLFWDGIHPTSGGHALISQNLLAAISSPTLIASAVPVPEPATVWMFVIGAAGLTAWRRRAAVAA